MAYCINHPAQPARAKCKICSDPLCRECKLTKPGGVFCSEKCFTEYERIRKGLDQNEELQKSVGSGRGVLRKLFSLVYIIILLAVIYAILTFLGIDIQQYIPW